MSDIRQITNRFGTHYYDFGCKNQSFLLTAKELKTVGVENYYFMLRIDDPRVADIDPFNPNITKQEMEALMHEAYHNIWFFERTMVRMRTDSGIVPYCLHRGLAASTWCFERHQDYCLNEPRQTYKTTGNIGGPILWAFQTSRNLHMHFFGKETDNTKRNLEHLKNNIELLPEWLQFRRYMDSSGKVKKTRQSTETLRNDLFKNELEIHPKPSSLSHAQSLGRGGSGAILYFDEIEHTPFFGEVLSNSAPLFKTASENAAKAGLPYCRIMSCTPGNLDTREGHDSYPIIKSMIPWTEKAYDMSPEELQMYKDAFIQDYHESEEKHSREVIDVFYIEYQYFQVRKTYEWVQQQYKLSGDKMAIRREILLQRLRGSTESPIDPEDIEYLISHMKKSTRDLIIDKKWRFRIYDHGAGSIGGMPKDLDENIPYLVGIDPAAGGGGDNFSITVVNPFNLQVAAEFKSQYLPGPMAVQLLVDLVENHIPKAVLVIEKNSMGQTIIQFIVDQTTIKKNLYWSEKDAAKQLEELTAEGPDDYKLKEMAMQYKKYGTYLTKKVRDAMFEILFQHVAQAKQILVSEYLVDDICKLVKTSTGRIEAGKGEHDDCVMSYLHAMYVYYNGDNLERFGIIANSNPIIGVIQPDAEKRLQEDDALSGFFKPEQARSFNDIVMEDAARVENQIKEMVGALSFVRDSVYSKDHDGLTDPYDHTVNISSSFFDSLNGT